MGLDYSKMTKQELQQLLEAKVKAESTGLQVKLNSGGGVYIRHDSFKEWSTAKQKEYVAGLNIGFVTAKALFNNPELIAQIRDSINGLK